MMMMMMICLLTNVILRRWRARLGQANNIIIIGSIINVQPETIKKKYTPLVHQIEGFFSLKSEISASSGSHRVRLVIYHRRFSQD